MNSELSLMERFADPVLLEQMSNVERVQGSLITTMMGMGITFVVLLLLWGMIALMTMVFNTKTVKPSAPAIMPTAAPVAAPAAPAVSSTSVSTDVNSELIAVITAAIAAMEGESSSTSNLIVRKISRISGYNNSWSKAGTSETIDSRKF